MSARRPTVTGRGVHADGRSVVAVEETIDGVQVRRFPVPVPSRHFAVSPSLGRALMAQRGKWDVVHVHGYHSVVPLLATLAGARPLMFTPHYHGTGHSPLRKALHLPYRRFGALITSASRRVICVSEAELACWSRISRERSTRPR